MYRTVRGVRGLRGFVGQQAPRFPYGLGRLRGFVGQRAPRFPYGLGCDGCSGKRLGQDDLTDSGSGNLINLTDQSLTLPAVYGPPPPPAGSLVTTGPASGPGYDFEPLTGPLQTYGPGGWSTPATVPSPSSSGVIPVYNNPSVSPLSYGSMVTTGGIAAPASSSLTSYLPLFLLGLGGIVLIAVVKRK